RRSGVPVTARRSGALPLSPRPSVCVGPRRYGSPRRLRARRIVERTLRRELELARPGLVPPELPPDLGAAEVPLLLRRHAEGGVSDGLDDRAQSLAGRHRAVAAADALVSTRRGRPAACVRRHREVPTRPALARPDLVLRILPRRQRRG